MNKNFTFKLIAFIMLLNAVTITSCKKAGEISDAIDKAVDDAANELLGVKALTEELDKTSSNYNLISDLVINNKLFSSGTEIKMTLPSSVPYSYTKKRYSLSGSMWTITTTNYSGTMPRSMFTNKSSANTVKIAISGNTPAMSVNGTTVYNGNNGTVTDPGSGTNTGGPITLVDREVTGKVYTLTTVSFTVPTGVKTMKVLITEKTLYYRQFADLFVRRGSAPIVAGPKPPTELPKYNWTADYYDIGVNRENREVTINNPSSGTWYAGLYGYNMDFQSQLIVTYTK